MSKADKIRRLFHLPNVVIAERLRCHEAYVRAVRQRTSTFGNPIETEAGARWKERNTEQVREYRRRSDARRRQAA